ncbi:hypothetical protein C8R46DRAFT_1356085 [Mycena filopes]|nr:hypothetical protein C8R46DRAFT_1356085 [Mycena filopes]
MNLRAVRTSYQTVTSFRPRLMSLSTPPQILIDDAFLCGELSSNNCFLYTGTQWTGATKKVLALDQTVHSLPANFSPTDTWSVRFSGTAINVFGSTACEATPCTFDLQVDGGPITRESTSSFASILQLTADQLGNQSPNHTLTVSNMSHPQLPTAIDYAIVDAPLDTPLHGQSAGQLWADINNSAIVYHGAWHKGIEGIFNAEIMQTDTVGDSLSFDFIGDSIIVIGVATPSVQGNVSLEVIIDNSAPWPQGFISNGRGLIPDPLFIYFNSNSSLTPAQHHVEITVAGLTGQQVFEFRGMLYHSLGNTLGDAIALNATTSSMTSSDATSLQGPLVPLMTSSALSSPSQSSGLNRKSHPRIAGPVVGGVGAVLVAALLLLILWHGTSVEGTIAVSQPRTRWFPRKRAATSAPPVIILIDDNFLCGESSSNNCFAYTGTQWTADGDSFSLDETVHALLVTSSATNAWSVRFSGTTINVMGISTCDTPPCTFDLQVDGGPVTREPTSSLNSILQLTVDQLGNQTLNHTLTVSNMSHSETIVDYAIVDAPLHTPLHRQSAGQLWADINNTAIAYHGAWRKGRAVFDVEPEVVFMQSNTVGDSFSFDFIGDSIVVIGFTNNTVQGGLSLEVTVDNGAPWVQGFITLAEDTPNPFFNYYNSNMPLFRIGHSSGLNPKSHPSIAGPVAGGVVGAVLVAALLLLIFWVRRRRRGQRLLPLQPITPFQQEHGTAATSQPQAWLVSRKRAIISAPPAVARSVGANGSDTPPVAQGEIGTAGILRTLMARMDALMTERGPPPYVG